MFTLKRVAVAAAALALFSVSMAACSSATGSSPLAGKLPGVDQPKQQLNISPSHVPASWKKSTGPKKLWEREAQEDSYFSKDKDLFISIDTAGTMTAYNMADKSVAWQAQVPGYKSQFETVFNFDPNFEMCDLLTNAKGQPSYRDCKIYDLNYVDGTLKEKNSLKYNGSGTYKGKSVNYYIDDEGIKVYDLNGNELNTGWHLGSINLTPESLISINEGMGVVHESAEQGDERYVLVDFNKGKEVKDLAVNLHDERLQSALDGWYSILTLSPSTCGDYSSKIEMNEEPLSDEAACKTRYTLVHLDGAVDTFEVDTFIYSQGFHNFVYCYHTLNDIKTFAEMHNKKPGAYSGFKFIRYDTENSQLLLSWADKTISIDGEYFYRPDLNDLASTNLNFEPVEGDDAVITYYDYYKDLSDRSRDMTLFDKQGNVQWSIQLDAGQGVTELWSIVFSDKYMAVTTAGNSDSGQTGTSPHHVTVYGL